MTSKIFKLAVCQVKQSFQKKEIIDFAKDQIAEAASNGAKVVVLGECWNALYKKNILHESAEPIDNSNPSPTIEFLKKTAKQHKIYLIGGSIPEKDKEENFFNTSVAFNKEGDIIAKYRKLHLFDVDIPGKITYKESETFHAGNLPVVFDTEYCKFGLGICYDVRFSELALLMARMGAKVVVYPANFNYHTGKMHWDLVLKSRALDTQTYIIGAAAARFIENQEIYQSWAHSKIVDPLAKVVSECEESPEIIYGDIDLNYLEDVRKQIPCQYQRRNDIYKISPVNE